MPKDATHFEKLNEMLRAYRTSNILFSAFELKIFELFSDGKLSFDQIRPKTKCSPRGLKMLLDALVALGLIRFQKNNYELRSEYSDYLNSRSKKYIGGMLSHEMHLSKRWQNLTKSVRSSKPAKKKNEHFIWMDMPSYEVFRFLYV